MFLGYCPKCKSRLYPQDEEYMMATGFCGYCVTMNNNKLLLATYQDYIERKKSNLEHKKRRR